MSAAPPAADLADPATPETSTPAADGDPLPEAGPARTDTYAVYEDFRAAAMSAADRLLWSGHVYAGPGPRELARLLGRPATSVRRRLGEIRAALDSGRTPRKSAQIGAQVVR